VNSVPDIYTNGRYLERSRKWHVEDSAWKAQQIIKMIKRNGLAPETVCEVGCGAGEILHQLHLLFSKNINYTGFEISPQAYELCKEREKENIVFFLKDFTKEANVFFDLVLLIDVIEHVENMYDFLRTVKEKGEYKIFHIPLDLYVLNLIKESNLVEGLNYPGHIHFFTKKTAIRTLQNQGYEIVDYFCTPAADLPNKTLMSKLIRPAQRLSYRLNSGLGMRIFGGSSLLVLSK
jgi:SAM-dependent methyltransferase